MSTPIGEKTYSIAENGEERGEFTVEEIVSLVQSNQVRVENAVYLDSANRWAPLKGLIEPRLKAIQTMKLAKAAAAAKGIEATTYGYQQPSAVVNLKVLGVLQVIVGLVIGVLTPSLSLLIAVVAAAFWLFILAEIIGYLAKIEFNTRKP